MMFSEENIQSCVVQINFLTGVDKETFKKELIEVLYEMGKKGIEIPVQCKGVLIVPMVDLDVYWCYVTTHLDCSKDTWNYLHYKNNKELH